MHDKVADIPVDQIIEPRTMLRLVDKASVEYLEMRDSIAADGFWNSISVRPAKDEGEYEIIDGLYRYTCARELGLESMPCIIKQNVSDDAVLAAQIQANAIRPETKPVEFAQQMKRILTRRPEMTFDELAHMIHKSPSWVRQTLGLLRLVREARKMVDWGEIPLRSAYMLAKIPQQLQKDYLDQARALPSGEFRALAASVIKQFTEAIRQGKLETFWCNDFKPQAHLRSLTDIQREAQRQDVGALLVTVEHCRTPVDGFYAALRWAMHLDRQSVEDQERAARARSRQSLLNEECEVDHVTD
jgi:ParB/RepB/Spo0J family partition protein